MPGIAPIVLVNMPMAAVERPSLSLGLLKAVLENAGIASRVVYANMSFLEYIGADDFLALEYTLQEDALVDWLFAGVAFPDFVSDSDAFFRDHFKRNRIAAKRAHDLERRLRALRERMPQYIDWVADKVLTGSPKVVGCTSMFQQHVASLALLRRVRERAPDVVTLLGGANCETLMGLTAHRHFDWVDYVVSGEADGFIVPFCADLLERGRLIPLADLPLGVFGPAHRQAGYPATKTGDFVPRAVTEDMRGLPLPDFDDYFGELMTSLHGDRIEPGLLMEFSRGCWWGERSHCTFCGLNGGSMSYRQKPAAQAAQEIITMTKRYNSRRIEAVDNILAVDYIDAALPQLTALEDKPALFFEVKANLKRHEVQKLAAAGVRWIQPGIESLDTRVLKLVAKGTTAAHNVQLLKWCRQYGVRLSWSVLWGFPGEQDDWYAEMAALIPPLHHLQPTLPQRLRYQRYSPYFQKADHYGLRLQSAPAYRHVYPLAERDLFDLVYYFEDSEETDAGGHIAGLDPNRRPGLHALMRALTEWTGAWKGPRLPALLMSEEDDTLVIEDSRAVAVAPKHRIRGIERRVLLAADEGVPEALTRERLKAEGVGGDVVDSAIAVLVERKLLLQLDSRLVGLPLRKPFVPMPLSSTFPGGNFNRLQALPLAAE